MATVLSIISYDGKNYYGWQSQPHKVSVQEKVEFFLSKILDEKIKIDASGRTDKGVHALGQTFSFKSNKIKDLEKLRYALNRLLPDDIFIKSMRIVDDDFHARFNVKEKIYLYKINTNEKDPFQKDYEYQYYRKLDIAKMKEASKLFLGEHCFINFTSKEEDDWNYIRTINYINIEENNGHIVLELSGNGFMRYMVRMMVGTLLKVGINQLNNEQILTMLNSKASVGGATKVPACGLYLKEVKY